MRRSSEIPASTLEIRKHRCEVDVNQSCCLQQSFAFAAHVTVPKSRRTVCDWWFRERIDRCCQTSAVTSAQPQLLNYLAVSFVGVFVDDAEDFLQLGYFFLFSYLVRGDGSLLTLSFFFFFFGVRLQLGSSSERKTTDEGAGKKGEVFQ